MLLLFTQNPPKFFSGSYYLHVKGGFIRPSEIDKSFRVTLLRAEKSARALKKPKNRYPDIEFVNRNTKERIFTSENAMYHNKPHHNVLLSLRRQNNSGITSSQARSSLFDLALDSELESKLIPHLCGIGKPAIEGVFEWTQRECT